MKLDLEILALWAGTLTAIITFGKLIVQPLSKAIKRYDATNKSLEEAVKELTRDLKESQEDRKRIHQILELHNARIQQNRDDILVNKEQIKTLFNNDERHDRRRGNEQN